MIFFLAFTAYALVLMVQNYSQQRVMMFLFIDLLMDISYIL